MGLIILIDRNNLTKFAIQLYTIMITIMMLITMIIITDWVNISTLMNIEIISLRI